MHFRGLIVCLLPFLFWQKAGAGVAIDETPLGKTADYNPIKAVTFSTDSRHLAFLGVKGEKQFVVSDGVEGMPFDWIIPDSLAGPLDLSRVAFIVQNGNDMAAVVDGKVVGS